MDLIADYSSDEGEGESHEQHQGVKRRRGCVKNLSADDVPSDIFERIVPHVRGNWAGHVFCSLMENDREGEWKQHAEVAIERFRIALEESGWSGTVVSHGQLHVSLSRPFFLQLASIESFQRELQDALSHERDFVLQMDEELILSNDEGTRSFFGWKLTRNPALNRIVGQIDAVMLKYKQQVYYDPPIFHVSLASVQGKLFDNVLGNLEETGDDEIPESLVRARKISCTFGTTKRLDIPLAA